MPYIWRCQISYNGSGTFLINSAGQPVVPGTTITTTAFNALTADLASGLTTAMTKDGQTVPTANIPMGGFKLTGLGAGTSATDAAQFGQLQNALVATLITVSGADTITGTLVQTLTAYATGQQFSFVAAGTNTTAVTLNIDGLGAKAVTRTGAVALAAGALVSGQMAIVEYDGTRFQLINANAFTNLTVSGALTVGTTLAVTGVATLTAQPILSSLTASLPVFTDASKGLVSNAMTGTGSVMMSASPTTTGTLTAAAINASGLVAMAGAATIGTTLAVTGTTTAAAINASGKLTVSSTSVTQNTKLITTGTAGFNALTFEDANPSITDFGVVGATTTANKWFLGFGSSPGALGSAVLTWDRLSAVTMAGAATVGTTLGVTGASTLTGNVSFRTMTSPNLIAHPLITLDTSVTGQNITLDVNESGSLARVGPNSNTQLDIITANTARISIAGTGAVTIPGTLGVTGGAQSAANTTSAPNNTATALVTLPSNGGLFIVHVYLASTSNAPAFHAYAMIATAAGTNGTILHQVDGTNMFITMALNVVSGRQTAGSTQNIECTYLRIQQ